MTPEPLSQLDKLDAATLYLLDAVWFFASFVVVTSALILLCLTGRQERRRHRSRYNRNRYNEGQNGPETDRKG